MNYHLLPFCKKASSNIHITLLFITFQIDVYFVQENLNNRVGELASSLCSALRSFSLNAPDV